MQLDLINNKILDTKDSVFIIDGSSFLYRAYYSIRPLHDPSGKPVQAVYGFARMIKRLIDTYNPKYMVLVWDSPGKTERHIVYEKYKETRQAMPSDLVEQKNLIKEFADIINLPQIQTSGIEADDLMFSLAKFLEKDNIKSILVSSDKDMRQALDKNNLIIILDPFKDEFITAQIMEERMGFAQEKIPFYYALIGDTSDNIPGVKGIGPKGAQEIVKNFSSLEDLYENLDKTDKLTDRTKNLLITNKDNAFLSEKLFKLKFYDLKMTLNCCKFDPTNWKKTYDLFSRLNFKSLIKDLPTTKLVSQTQTQIFKSCLSEKYNFKTINKLEDLQKLCDLIKQKKYFALDTEGTSLNIYAGSIVGISIAVDVETAYYVPFGHKTSEEQLERKTVLDLLKPLLEDPNIEKYLHHAKFDALMLSSENINIAGVTFDTMIAASLVVADGQRVGLKYLSEYYFQEPMLFFKDILAENKYKDFSYVPLEKATKYAAADAHQTLKLFYKLKEALKEQNLLDLFLNLEMPLLNILLNMEKEGIILDLNKLKEIDKTVTCEIGSLRNQILDLIGLENAEINLNSPKQLEDLLFNKLKLPVVKKTTGKTGYSTDQEVLNTLAKIHPVPALIARYREVFKIKSTYIDSLSEYINKKTGKIHTTFSQTIVSTGRLSSSEPNLQNIPVDKFHIRSAFKAQENNIFISADYSQIELRVLAYLSQDKNLIEAFKNNKDIHAITAAGLFNISPELVNSEQRKLGKKINFSILYGLTPFGLAKDLDISQKLAKEYIDKYMAQFPGVFTWMESVVKDLLLNGYVTTYLGRRRYLPGIFEKNRNLFELAKRVAINTKAQGTAADIMKLGMINLDKNLKSENLKSKILLQIHDELLIEVPESEIDKAEKLIQKTLISVTDWNVPLEVNISKGKNWQDVTK